MNLAFCYESVLPSRGGCETYIASLARRLAADKHEIHLYARRWDAAALPASVRYHKVKVPHHPRFLRPWYFGAACRRQLAQTSHDLTIGFDKISGLDVLYPQGGLYAATSDYNLLKYPSKTVRRLIRAVKIFDPAHHSFMALERAQYRVGRSGLGKRRPLVVAISNMVQDHFQHYYGFEADDLRVVRIATNPERFDECDRPRRRLEFRALWNLSPESVVALFAGMNYRLKGLDPLLHAMKRLTDCPSLHLVVAGKPEVAPFERLAKQLGIADKVRFVGYCNDMRNGYFASDFLVHPTFYDPCSNVVLEALACGLPVITTRYNGACELLQPPREGYVVDDPHDQATLAWSMRQLMDPIRRASCAAAARRTGAQWTFEHHYRALLADFAEAAERKRAAG
jgi:UDP-glucose:(heptosyl)LPS alpha-1,3-glucosyltransferase